MKKVSVRNTTSKQYATILKRIEKDKVCPFCEEHFLTYHTRPIIKKGKHWILTENFTPYAGTTQHLLLVSRKHVEHFDELTAAAQAELFALLGPEVKRRKMKGGSLFMRFGDGDYTHSSVRHLHAHVVVGVKRGKDTEALLAPLGFKKRGR